MIIPRRVQQIKSTSLWIQELLPGLLSGLNPKMAQLAGSYLEFQNQGEGVLGTHLKLKKSKIQWNKFEVLWSSVAQSN